MIESDIKLVYKNAYIKFNPETEEWIAYLNQDGNGFYTGGTDEFKRNSSLKRLKEAVDKFNAKKFEPIPIVIFDSQDEARHAEIISFTTVQGECWIRREDGRRELIKTVKLDRFGHFKDIYVVDNVINEPLFIQIGILSDEIKKAEKELSEKKAERTRLISNLQKYDIVGLAIAPDEDIVM